LPRRSFSNLLSKESNVYSVDNWYNASQQRKFLEDIASKLKLKEHEDWYKVTNEQVIELGGDPLLYPPRPKVALKLLQETYRLFDLYCLLEYTY
jgi:hypothetical protein